MYKPFERSNGFICRNAFDFDDVSTIRILGNRSTVARPLLECNAAASVDFRYSRSSGRTIKFHTQQRVFLKFKTGRSPTVYRVFEILDAFIVIADSFVNRSIVPKTEKKSSRSNMKSQLTFIALFHKTGFGNAAPHLMETQQSG